MRHIGTSIDGLLGLSDYRLKKLAPSFKVDGKPLRTSGEVKRALREAKAAGLEVIPSDECDNYDEKGRCKGHENAYGSIWEWRGVPEPTKQEGGNDV